MWRGIQFFQLSALVFYLNLKRITNLQTHLADHMRLAGKLVVFLRLLLRLKKAHFIEKTPALTQGSEIALAKSHLSTVKPKTESSACNNKYRPRDQKTYPCVGYIDRSCRSTTMSLVGLCSDIFLNEPDRLLVHQMRQ
jgi:hypothetical protein